MDHLGSVVTLCLIFCHVLKSGVEGQGGVRSYDFYKKSCPQVENIIRTGLQPIFFADLPSPAAFLRLMFHDCQVQVAKIKGMEPSFEFFLRWNCRKMSITSNSSFAPNDPSAFVFDNLYYHNAMGGRGLLRIDAEMVMDLRTKQTVWRFAADESAFFGAFSSAFVKLSCSGVLVGNKGVIRKKCNVLE